MRAAQVCLVMAALSGWAASARGQSSLAGTTFHITRATGPIRIDGDLSDEPWRTAIRIDTWYEVQPGDNGTPPVKSVGHLTYDDRFFYAAFEFDDPTPSTIRAPLGDHDAISGNSMDFGGIFIDPLNTGRTAFEFFVTPRNVQYDAVTDDASGENSSPDFFWDSAARITDRGWILEMRIPFSTLRYRNLDPQTWGIILFRNYPRQYRYQLMSAKIPRGNNCLICHENLLSGLERLPKGGHLIAAPYVSATDTARPAGDVLGSPLVAAPLKPHAGIDVKFTPNANNAIDLTVKPDFSQVESDTAQISANERFALFFPEKRPFFLEGVDLLQTPIQAVYTRTITAPAWGGRVTGKEGGVRYTALVAEDAGGGSAVLPGPTDSSTVSQDFASRVFVGRAKREIGLSFVGALVTDREAVDAAAHNRVAGPDFQWRPSGADVVTGQWLFSETRTPDRPDLAGEWNGQQLNGSAFQINWNHNTRHLDWSAKYNNVASGFRADTGFVPQVGYREGYGSAGWTVHATGRFVSSARPFVTLDYQVEPSGSVITRDVEPGIEMNTRWSGFMQFRFVDNPTRARNTLIGRKQFAYNVQFSPSRLLSSVNLNGTLGQDIDFENARAGHGSTINASATVQPTDHLALDLLENTRWLNVDNSQPVGARLFIQRVSRVKGTYTFTSRLFVRVIGQYVATTRNPSMYLSDVDARSGEFGGSALFAYKLNWQSVMFVGYGDDRELMDQRHLERLDRQVFVKLSYAFQR
jgi:Domain of unknown function (DUF5916)